MKKILLSLMFLISGCYTQSLSTFYTEDLIIELPQIEGEWISSLQLGVDVSDKEIPPWKFTAGRIETYEKNKNYSELEVVYFEVGDHLFMDFTAGRPAKDWEDTGNFFWGAGITITHSICKVFIEGDTLTIIPADIEWFEERIKDKNLDLSFFQADENSNYIFTVTSEQWVSFLKQHAEDKDLFNEKYRFVFRR